jgi:branched-chain amino acid transport system substrate-binding protein
MIAALRENQFDTVLGPVGFDQKGDVTLQSPVLYVWHADGEHTPLEEQTKGGE